MQHMTLSTPKEPSVDGFLLVAASPWFTEQLSSSCPLIRTQTKVKHSGMLVKPSLIDAQWSCLSSYNTYCTYHVLVTDFGGLLFCSSVVWGPSWGGLSRVPPRWTGVTRAIKCQCNNKESGQACAETLKYCNLWCSQTLSNQEGAVWPNNANENGGNFSRFIANMPRDVCFTRSLLFVPSCMAFIVIPLEYHLSGSKYL